MKVAICGALCCGKPPDHFCYDSQVGKLRCELSYRRCETSVEDMVRMIDVEVQGVEEIEKELEVGAIDVNDIENR